MKRVFWTTVISTTATIAAWILIRGDLGLGGEMLIPAGLAAWAVYREAQEAQR